jgi:hypothetical protein
MEKKMKHANQQSQTSRDGELVQLSYCQRCGALHVGPAGSAAPMCPGCARIFRWLGGEVRRAARNL